MHYRDHDRTHLQICLINRHALLKKTPLKGGDAVLPNVVRARVSRHLKAAKLNSSVGVATCKIRSGHKMDSDAIRAARA